MSKNKKVRLQPLIKKTVKMVVKGFLSSVL